MKFLKLILSVLFLITCLTIYSYNISDTANRPNFLIILADDLGSEQLGCYGNTINKTPSINKLAKEGMLFRTAYTVPVCTPSRVLLMTGKYGNQTGWLNYNGKIGTPNAYNKNYILGSAERTFAHVLSERGYNTGLMGRWLTLGDEHIRIPKAGFDEYQIWAYNGHKLPPGIEHNGPWQNKVITSRYWHPCIIRDGEYIETTEEEYGPNLMVDYGREFFKQNKDKPFLLFYSMILPHDPYLPVPDIKNPGKRKDGSLQAYVEYTDYLVGELLEGLEQSGLTENTIVIFIGDNGTAGQGKATPTEKGARVPCIVRNSKFVKPNIVSDELTDFSDIFPTLLDYANIPIAEELNLDGKSLVKTLANPLIEHRPWIYSYYVDKQILRDKRWLYENGRFYDCGNNRNGDYIDVSLSQEAEVIYARSRFNKILHRMAAKDCQFVTPQ